MGLQTQQPVTPDHSGRGYFAYRAVNVVKSQNQLKNLFRRGPLISPLHTSNAPNHGHHRHFAAADCHRGARPPPAPRFSLPRDLQGAGVRAPELRHGRVPPVGGVYIAAAPGCHRLRPPPPPLCAHPRAPPRRRRVLLLLPLRPLRRVHRSHQAVCYLNNHGKDYKGGILRFQDGEPSSIVPVAGDVVIYTADNRNVHCVDEVTEGERLTLTLWFTRDSAYDEDPKLLTFLSQTSSNYEPADQNSYIPLPASDNMYWFSYDQSCFDIRCARVHILGFSFHASSDENSNRTSVALAEDDPIELLGKPLRLGRGDDVFEKIFANSLHALQVVQFYYWKAPELAARRKQTTGGLETVCYPIIQVQRSSGTELPLPCNHSLAETIFGSYNHEEFAFEWNDFVLAVAMWENYSEELKRKLMTFLPYWLSNESIFVVDSSKTEVCSEGN